MKKNKGNKGFSLIEMLIYISIMTIIITVVSALMSNTFNTYAKIRSTRNLNIVGASVVDRIVHNIRNAESINDPNSSFEINPSVLSLNMRNDADVLNTYVYNVDQGTDILTEQINSGEIMDLHTSRYSVTNFVLNKVDSGNTVGLRITISLQDKNIYPPKEETFQTFVLMRGSY